ncbi:MAG: RNA-binding protein [Candidatus Gracilibacteria bacterium]|jgi:RNA recognition motif-containing protein|nr:RNA-binding protein [Candidatus Gracilibacteria bacterium]
MSMKLYVGNISWNSTSESLKEYFEQFGAVEDAFIMKDKVTRRSKGFGFVTFTNEEDAQKAIEATNGKEFDGRALTVNEARPPKNDNF